MADISGNIVQAVKSVILGRSGNVQVSSGTGPPEGLVVGDVGSTYYRTDGSAGGVAYVKESGSGSTGWTAATVTGARQQAFMNAQGYFAETYPRGATSSASVMISGTVYYEGIGLVAGDVVTNILATANAVVVTPSGVGMKFGIYTKANVLVANTADVSASFLTVGAKSSALTTPYTVPTTDGYYLAVIVIAATGPGLWRSTAGLNGTGPFGAATLSVSAAQTGQIDLPATGTPTGGTFGLWLGVS